MSKKTSTSLDDESASIYDKYFEYTRTYQEKYGKLTVILMMVGSFFEIYGLKSVSGDVSASEISEVARICQMNISEKKRL